MSNRRWFLIGAAGAAAGAAPAWARRGMRVTERKLPTEVLMEPAWMSWVGATTACLKALGVDCDTVEVAGMTGYAFVLNIHSDGLVGGPCGWDLMRLIPGVKRLGRSVEVFCGWLPGDDLAEIEPQLERCFDLARAEIDAGRPCVVWGTYVPEFGLVNGYSGEQYLVSSFRRFGGEPEPPIAYNELMPAGGPMLFSFPTPVPAYEGRDRFALRQAVTLAEADRAEAGGPFGLAGYRAWLGALEQGTADTFGHSYCLQCFGESRWQANEFVHRVSLRNPDQAVLLEPVGAAYAAVADAFARLTATFTWPPPDQPLSDEQRTRSAALLRQAQEAETDAVGYLGEALADWD